MKITGINSVSEALKSGKVNKIFVLKDVKNPRIKEIVSLAKRKKIPVVYTPNLPKNARGVMAEISPVKYKDVDLIIEKCIKDKSFILFLD